MSKPLTEPKVRKAAMRLLATGTATLPEVARLCGVSTHVVWGWCAKERLDWKRQRNAKLVQEWRRELKR